MKKASIIISIIIVALLIIVAIIYTSPREEGSVEDATAVELSAEGLSIDVLEEGNGPEAQSGDTVSVHYTGTLEDGTKFDSSLDRGTPFSFTLGAGQVIPGWDLGVLGMKVGETRRLIIPSDLAYGEQGVPGTIPGGATLIFEVELIKIMSER